MVERGLEVRTRGHYRRDWQTCPFPPLRLNFKTSEVKRSLFHGQDKLKLVTHCDRRYEQFVLQEYMLYRVYNLLTERSFRVRLVEITYVEPGSRSVPQPRYAFFIEDIESVAERNGFVAVEEPEIPLDSFDPDALALVGVFEYMAGNTDWSVLRGPEGGDCCHNTVPIRAPDGRVVAVPFDFDLAGAVNAPYATANEELGLRSVRERLYRGFCTTDVHLERAVELFRERRGDIYTLYTSEERLDPRQRSSALAYFDRFYNVISDPARVRRSLVEKCR